MRISSQELLRCPRAEEGPTQCVRIRHAPHLPRTRLTLQRTREIVIFTFCDPTRTGAGCSPSRSPGCGGPAIPKRASRALMRTSPSNDAPAIMRSSEPMRYARGNRGETTRFTANGGPAAFRATMNSTAVSRSRPTSSRAMDTVPMISGPPRAGGGSATGAAGPGADSGCLAGFSGERRLVANTMTTTATRAAIVRRDRTEVRTPPRRARVGRRPAG